MRKSVNNALVLHGVRKTADYQYDDIIKKRAAGIKIHETNEMGATMDVAQI